MPDDDVQPVDAVPASPVSASPVPADAVPVSVVVVSYNVADELERCITSLLAEGVGEVVVVDNGSRDDSYQRVQAAGANVHWLPTGANLGYGGAVNRAVPYTTGRYLAVANPDLVVQPGALGALVARLEAEPDLALVGPRVLNPDGTTYPSARRFPDLVDAIGHGVLGLFRPENRFTRRYRMTDEDHSRPARVDWVSAAFFLARREAWEQLGGFDSSYFMYSEDVDLCWRAGRAGWGVGYEPTAVVVHAQGSSTRQHPYRMLAAHHRSMWQFAWRTTSGPARLALPVVALGLAGRLAVASLRRRLGR